MFIKTAPNSHGFVNPRDIEDIWRDHFDYFYREYDQFIFPITIHPDVSGFDWIPHSGTWEVLLVKTTISPE